MALFRKLFYFFLYYSDILGLGAYVCSLSLLDLPLYFFCSTENPQIALSTLRENVTSKGGTTAAALAVFDAQHFNQTIEQAMQACLSRSQEMETLF